MAKIAIVTGATGGLGQEFIKEIQKNDEIDELNESLYQAKTFIWALGFVSICLLLFILRKNFTFLFEKLTH